LDILLSQKALAPVMTDIREGNQTRFCSTYCLDISSLKPATFFNINQPLSLKVGRIRVYIKG